MRNWFQYIVLLVVLLITWQYFGSSNNTVKILISSPTACLQYFSENKQQLLGAVAITAFESIIGLIAATGIAFILMGLCFRFPSFYKFILPIVLTTQVIPLITLAPFFILWLGIGVSSKIALAATISFYPVFMNFATGYNAISSNIFDLLDIYKAKRSFRILKVYFPLSLPNIFTGLKVAATLSVIGAIVAEFSGTDNGLGKNLLLSSIRIEPELMMLSIFFSALVGGALFGFIFLIERISGKWYLNSNKY
ncbi:MAG TPA: ABC transporter permease subunit [Mucilaginibacter sp.]|jgi:NitT/TauT family transport system permease protein